MIMQKRRSVLLVLLGVLLALLLLGEVRAGAPVVVGQDVCYTHRGITYCQVVVRSEDSSLAEVLEAAEQHLAAKFDASLWDASHAQRYRNQELNWWKRGACGNPPGFSGEGGTIELDDTFTQGRFIVLIERCDR